MMPGDDVLPNPAVGQVEVFTGTGRRRRWSAEAKARIVAETYATSVGDVSAQHATRPLFRGSSEPNHLHGRSQSPAGSRRSCRCASGRPPAALRHSDTSHSHPDCRPVLILIAAQHWRKAQGDGAPPVDAPLAVTGRIGARKIVVDADAAARAQGVHPGLASAHAHARVPGLLTVEHDPANDAAALERIALWALRRYAPLVAVDGAAGVWIDASGVAHLFGGEAAVLEDLVGRIARGGAHARAAMADSAGAAWALARFGPSQAVVSAKGEADRDIDPLPLAALRLSAEMLEGLSKLGMETVGEVERTPRAPLALRFGPELTRRLDQAYGRMAEVFEPLQPAELVRVRRAFFEPIWTCSGKVESSW